MRVFKTRHFARFAKDEGVEDEQLAAAIHQAEGGLIDAELGGGLIKLRIARPGGGKRGGYRTILAYRTGTRAVFLFGFAKNERENITPDQLADFKTAASDLLSRSEQILKDDVEKGRLQEVIYHEDD
jgi:hypothetical protein